MVSQLCLKHNMPKESEAELQGKLATEITDIKEMRAVPLSARGQRQIRHGQLTVGCFFQIIHSRQTRQSAQADA
eukprot:1140082-Pelagomonas_calceolata.AAC.3